MRSKLIDIRAVLAALIVLLSLLSSCNAQELTLEQKVAKMVMVGFHGTKFDINNQVVKDIRDAGVGGVILFEKNITPIEKGEDSKTILTDLCTNLMELADGKLLLAIDQEGGRVNRLRSKYGFPEFVSAEYLGELDNIDSTRHYAALLAEAVSGVGLNTNFTPVADMIVDPQSPAVAKIDRSYSSDAQEVIQHASIMVEEHHKRNIRTSLKHFPGHGSASVDSHNGFTDITQTWSPQELVPFKSMIDNTPVDMVMVGHLFNSTIDKNYPASLSKSTVEGLLRTELGWKGFVITDDMMMKAIADNYSFEESVMLGINAGIDMFIYSGNTNGYKNPQADLFITTVCKLVREGKIDIKRIDESYERWLKIVE